jgi:hypothetical protein
MDYWEEAFCFACEEAGIPLPSKEQRKLAADSLEHSHDMYGMAMGHDCIPNPLNTEVKELQEKIKSMEKEHRKTLQYAENYIAERINCGKGTVHVHNDGEITHSNGRTTTIQSSQHG